VAEETRCYAALVEATNSHGVSPRDRYPARSWLILP